MAPPIVRVDGCHMAPAHSSLKICPWASIGWNSLSLGLGIRPPPKKASRAGPTSIPGLFASPQTPLPSPSCVITLRCVGLLLYLGTYILSGIWLGGLYFIKMDTKKDTCYEQIGLRASLNPSRLCD